VAFTHLAPTAVTRKTSFYYAFLALPADKRRAITAVWDVCRAIDDSVDLESDPAKAKAGLDEWRHEIARVFGAVTPATTQGRALQPFVKPFHLPRTEFEALIEGVGMDITPRTYDSFVDLAPYCHRVASAVGLICAEIFGYKDSTALDYARDLGVALQLTNILRDVGADGRRGRLYVPLDDLARFNCTPTDIEHEIAVAGRGVQSPAVRAVLEHQASRARVFFSRAIRVLPKHDAGNFLPAEIMRAVYTDLLARIEAADYDVFTHVIRVPRPAQAMLAMRTWWRLKR
jgi:phytoene synthase